MSNEKEKTSEVPTRILVEVIGNDVNGKTGRQTFRPSNADQLLNVGGVPFQVNLNTTANQIVTLEGGTSYVITDVVMTNPSKAITTADGGGLYHDAIKNVPVIDISPNELTRLVAADNFISLLAGNLLYDSLIVINGTLYFAINTPEGSAATCDIYIYGHIIS